MARRIEVSLSESMPAPDKASDVPMFLSRDDRAGGERDVWLTYKKAFLRKIQFAFRKGLHGRTIQDGLRFKITDGQNRHSVERPPVRPSA
jgi:hypothetical protein